MRQIFGLDPQRSDLPDREEFLRLVHPEDRNRFNEQVDTALHAKADLVQDYRIVLPDGTVKHIHAIGHMVLDESGNIIEGVGTDMDVTERKQAEEKIRGQEVELRQILDAAPQHLSVLRSDGSHLYINQSSLDFLGLTLEEWQKRDIRELVHPDDAERVGAKGSKPFQADLRSRSKRGSLANMIREYRWLFLNYKPLRDQLGRITRWVVPAIDIDDRKRSEENCTTRTLRSAKRSSKHRCLRKLWARHRRCKPCSPAL